MLGVPALGPRILNFTDRLQAYLSEASPPI